MTAYVSESKMTTQLVLIRKSITTLAVDAIVNAANNTLLGGGGVDGIIHKAAGAELLAECRTLWGCETGKAKITKGYLLPAKQVIHTVGPRWQGGQKGEAELLASCYRSCLTLALKYRLKTIAFPAVSCGVYCYPIPPATKIAVTTTYDFVQQNPGIDTVYFVAFGSDTEAVYQAYFQELQLLDVLSSK